MWQLLWQGKLQAIVFWAAVYCALVGLASLVYELRIRSWPMAQGVLAHEGVTPLGASEWVKSDQQYQLKAGYRYQVGGRIFEGHRVLAWVVVASHIARAVLEAQRKGVQRNPDGTVSVHHNPKRPDKSYLFRPGLADLLITLCLVVGPEMYQGWRFHGG